MPRHRLSPEARTALVVEAELAQRQRDEAAESRRHVAASAASLVPPLPPANPWEAICRHVEQIVSPTQFHTWFEPAHFRNRENSSLYIEVPNEMFRSWLTMHGSESLQSALAAVCPEIHRLEWVLPAQAPVAKPETPIGVLLSDVKAERVEWLWHHRIPLGKLTIMDGDPDVGKSLVTLDMAARLSTGRPFPGATSGGLKAGTVVMSAEDGLGDTIRPRLEAAKADLSRIVALRYMAELPDEQTVSNIGVETPRITAAIKRVAAKLVLVDVLVAYLPSEANSFRDQDIRLALMPLVMMAGALRVAVLAIRHFTKQAIGSNPLYRGGGSIGIIGSARAAMLIARDPKDPSLRILAQSKSNLGPPMPSLGFRIRANEHGIPYVVWKGESAETAGTLLAAAGVDTSEHGLVTEAKHFLWRELQGGPVKRTDLEAGWRKAGISLRTIERAKGLLQIKSQKMGSGERSYWVWKLPPGVQRPPR